MSEHLTYSPDDERHDLIAYESLLLCILTDLDPDGRWKASELYQARQKRKYSGLTVRQFHQHLDQLEAAIDKLPKSAYQSWLSRHPQKSTDDSSCLITQATG